VVAPTDLGLQSAGEGECRLLTVSNGTVLEASPPAVFAEEATWHTAVTALYISEQSSSSSESVDTFAVCSQGDRGLPCRCQVLAVSSAVAGAASDDGERQLHAPERVGDSQALATGVALALALAPLASGHALVCIADGLSGRSIVCHALQQSSPLQQLHVGAGKTVHRGASEHLALAQLGPSSAVLCFSDWSDQEVSHCALLGVDITGTLEVVVYDGLTPSTGLSRYLALAPLKADKALLCYQREVFTGQFEAPCLVLTADHAGGANTLSAGPEVLLSEGPVWNLAPSLLDQDTALVCYSDSLLADSGRCRAVWGHRVWYTGFAKACFRDTLGGGSRLAAEAGSCTDID